MRFRLLFILLLTQISILLGYPTSWNSEGFAVLSPTERQPARTAVLIVTVPDDMLNLRNGRECRWLLGKKVWEKYMNAHPNVDCYFVQHTNLREGDPEQVWIEGKTISVKCGDENGGVTLRKTIRALEILLPQYTHFFRVNANMFVNLNALNEYAETHHQSMFTGPLWKKDWWFVVGYGVLFSADVAAHIVKEYRRLEDHPVVTRAPEDLILTSLATGICQYYGCIEHPGRKAPDFTCCPALPFGNRQLMSDRGFFFSSARLNQYGLDLFPAPSFKEAINYCNQVMNTAILYRIRSGFDLDKTAELYEYLLSNIYPELPKSDLVEYSKSLPTIRNEENF